VQKCVDRFEASFDVDKVDLDLDLDLNVNVGVGGSFVLCQQRD
jgi:hypothetical protein